MPIYFIRQRGTNLVKIGWAKSDVTGRVATLQTGSPATLEVLGQRPGERADEGRMHAKHFAAKVRGEWFRMTPALAEDIALCDERFAALARLSPELLSVARDAGDVEYGETFCAAAVWYGYDGPGLKEAMSRYVGMLRKSGPAELRTGQAYSVAYDVLMGLLPDCRNCRCLDASMLPG